MEFCAGGDVSNFLKKRGGRVPEGTAQSFLKHVALGLNCLNELHLIHRHIPIPIDLGLRVDSLRRSWSGIPLRSSPCAPGRDLKPHNLLLSEESPKAVVKIADFGFARIMAPQGLAETVCGSPLYMAPEVLSSSKYDIKADLWSVGTILYQMLVGATPYQGIGCGTALTCHPHHDVAMTSYVTCVLYLCVVR